MAVCHKFISLFQFSFSVCFFTFLLTCERYFYILSSFFISFSVNFVSDAYDDVPVCSVRAYILCFGPLDLAFRIVFRLLLILYLHQFTHCRLSVFFFFITFCNYCIQLLLLVCRKIRWLKINQKKKKYRARLKSMYNKMLMQSGDAKTGLGQQK